MVATLVLLNSVFAFRGTLCCGQESTTGSLTDRFARRERAVKIQSTRRRRFQTREHENMKYCDLIGQRLYSSTPVGNTEFNSRIIHASLCVMEYYAVRKILYARSRHTISRRAVLRTATVVLVSPLSRGGRSPRSQTLHSRRAVRC